MPGLFDDLVSAAPSSGGGLFDDLTPQKKQADWLTALKVLNESAATSIDKAISLPAGALASIFSQEEGDKIFREMEARERARMQYANPEQAELSTGQKIGGAIATLPVQALASLTPGAETGSEFIRKGESLPRAISASGVDTTGALLGLATGGVGGNVLAQGVTGAGLNVAQDYVSRKIIENIAQQEETKKQFAPSWETAAISAATGGAVPAAVAAGRGMPLTAPQGRPTPRPVPTPVEAPRQPISEQAQMELPLASSVEQIAQQRAQMSPQGDLFADLVPRDLAPDTMGPRVSPDIRAQAEAMARQREAQAAIEARQVAMEQDVARQGLLARNAAERARQEQAPTGFEEWREGQRQAAETRLPGDNTPLDFSRTDAPYGLGETPFRPDNTIDPTGFLAEEGAQPVQRELDINQAWNQYAKEQLAADTRQRGVDERQMAQEPGLIQLEEQLRAAERSTAPTWEELRAERGRPGKATAPRTVPGGQRGALDFKGIAEGLKGLLEPTDRVPDIGGIRNKNYIPSDPTPEKIVGDSLSEKADTSSPNWTKYTAAGSTLEGAIRKSSLVQGVSQILQNAGKRADLYINKTVLPFERSVRAMSGDEIKTLAGVLKEEEFATKLFTSDELQAKGLNEKQLLAYSNLRKLRENTLQIQNDARTQMGLDPITPREHGIASRWQGAFKQPVYLKGAEGPKLAWWLAGDSKRALDKQIDALKKEFPDAIIDPRQQKVVKDWRATKDMQALYTTMVDLFGRNDPDVQQIKQWYESAVETETERTLGQKKHFESKGNIRGFVGDRPGTNPVKEAREMLHQQVQYAKNAYNWASMQEAGQKLKGVFSNEELALQQPKNMDYSKELFKNYLGQGEAEWSKAINNALLSAGVSPSQVKDAVGGTKNFFITQKLAGNLRYTVTSLLQVVNTVPHLMDTLVKQGGNPVKAVIAGLMGGVSMASGHYMSAMGADFTKYLGKADFTKDAFKYAEDNGITSRSIYDEAPINQQGPLATAGRIAGKTLSVPETLSRSAAFMTFVSMLKDTGKFGEDRTALFQKAEELTNISMADYRTNERAMGFGKAGILGDVASTLQTFSVNYYNQLRYFGNEAMRGNPLPLMAFLGVQGAMAGVQGIPGFNDIDKLWQWAKGKVPDSVFAKVKDFDLKLWVLENFGEAALTGALSDQTGV